MPLSNVRSAIKVAVSTFALTAITTTALAGDESNNTIGVTLRESGIAPGYTLFAPLSASFNTYLIDDLGRQINTWTNTSRVGNSVYLNNDGDLIRTINPQGGSVINAGGAGGRVERWNWNNELEWSWSYISDEYRLHHDIELLPNGNILMIAWEAISSSDAIAAGREPGTFGDTLWPDKIIEVEPSGATGGTIVWEWRAWDHLIQFRDPALPNYGRPADYPHRIDVNYRIADESDWIHSNGIDYNAELDQIVISSRSFSEIWVIDHDTTTEEAAGPAGDLLYRWGNPEAYGRGTEADQTLFAQHDAKWIRPGMPGYPGITIFNNGNGRPEGNYSSVDQIDPPILKNGTYLIKGNAPFGPTEASWTYVDPDPMSFYAGFISGAERLANGNTLICSGPKGEFFEIDSDGNKLWNYITPLDGDGPMSQGEAPPSGGGGGGPGGASANLVFRAERYAPDFPGFTGKNLLPGPTIELYPECVGDLNFDRMVDGADLALILVAWSTNDAAADLNGDGLVDGADLAQVLVGWGLCP